DDELYPRVPRHRPWDRSPLPESVLEWRVVARAGGGPPPRARRNRPGGLAPPPAPPPPPVRAPGRRAPPGGEGGAPGPGRARRAAAAQLGWARGRVVQRLGELGYPVTHVSWPQSPPDRDERTLLSRNLDGRHPWLDPEQLAPVGHVLAAAAQLGWAPGRVVQRL